MINFHFSLRSAASFSENKKENDTTINTIIRRIIICSGFEDCSLASFINFIKRLPKLTTLRVILRGISSLSPDSSTFLEIGELKALCVMLQCDIQLLNNEIQVLKPMLKQLKPKNMIDLYFEVLPFQQAFPSILSLLIGAMTIPVSSTTTERIFSKMKLIKTAARNNMSDNRLSDLSLLAIERDFSIDYEKIIDAFAIQHKNSRIILK
jgi:hypothetical protein